MIDERCIPSIIIQITVQGPSMHVESKKKHELPLKGISGTCATDARGRWSPLAASICVSSCFSGLVLNQLILSCV